jgi:hypothetical protein
LFGQKGSGKNALAYSLLSLFGKRQTEFNVHNGTKPGLAKHLELFKNAIAFVDDYKNSLDFDKIETLKSIYNAIGRSRLNMDKGGKKETTEVNSAVILAGQEMPTIDVALSTRMIFLIFAVKENLSDYRKEIYESLQDMERDGLSHLSNGFIAERDHLVKFWKENFDIVKLDLMNKSKGKSINDRILRNICIPLATFRTLESKFDFAFTYNQLLESAVKIMARHNTQINKSDEMGIFWNLLESLADDNYLMSGWHYNTVFVSELTTFDRKFNWNSGKRILRYKFNSIYKIYAEHLRRIGGSPMPQDSLRHYLESHKSYIGKIQKCKFKKTEFSTELGKNVDVTQITSAFAFDYDLLDINLMKELAEKYNPNGAPDPDDRIESTVLAPADDLPY